MVISIDLGTIRGERGHGQIGFARDLLQALAVLQNQKFLSVQRIDVTASGRGDGFFVVPMGGNEYIAASRIASCVFLYKKHAIAIG